MEKQMTARDHPPRYLQIAIDFARKIAEQQYEVGDRVFARSAVASQYNVSSETARRAMCVLEDMKIVSAEKGSGVHILSIENAVAFLHQYQSTRTLTDLRSELMDNLNELQNIKNKISTNLDQLVDKTDRFKDVSPFVPYEYLVPEDSPLNGKTLAETNFWHHTMATIVAIQRQGDLILSPGPYALIKAKDILFFIGERSSYDRVRKYVAKNQ